MKTQGKLFFPALAALCGATLGACSLNPITLRPRLLVMSERQEERLGAKAAAELAERTGACTSGELGARVEQLGQSLAAAAPGPAFRYRFTLLDDPAPNAFAFPGGYVFVTRGLLALIRDEDELAGVLGHEIAHVAMQHAAERAIVSLSQHVVAEVITRPVGVFDERNAQKIRDQLVAWTVAPYNRAQEREADRVGAALAASWGYAPIGLARLLGRMARLDPHERLDPQSPAPASHPETGERVESIALYDGLMVRGPRDPGALGVTELYARLDGLPLGPSPNRGWLLSERSYLVPASRFALDLPEGWITSLTGDGSFSVSPDGTAMLTLTLLPRGASAAIMAEEICRELLVECLDPTGASDGRPVWRATMHLSDRRPMATLYWWLEHEGRVYQLSAHLPRAETPRFAATLDAAALSARMAAATELAALQAPRLRLATALADETVAALVARARSSWPAERVLLVNDLEPSGVLPTNVLIKIARDEALMAP
jgi:predicted Zn-dependent protease